MGTAETRRRIDLPAGTVHYREYGPADGPAIVFVHGFLVDDTLWSDVPERLAEQGFRTLAPTWPLGSHTTAMRPDAELSPRAVARIVLSFLEAMGLEDVTLVGNDTGGAVCQLLLDEDPSRIGRLVLTNCDAYDKFPPAPFGALFRVSRHPSIARPLMATMRVAALRNGLAGFGGLVERRLASAESWRWVAPYLADAGVRRDVARFARGWRPTDLVDAATWLTRFDRPVLLCWAPADRFFRIGLAHRLAADFPDSRIVEIPDAKTFVALDQPARLAEEIGAFARAAVGTDL
ncbi:MAG TPA: alpha/beta hydrolase [Nocardioides sp.]|nr:alpha/beta hydrolase [Nocardioides sp.]